MYLGKVMYYLNKKVQEKAEDPKVKTEDIMKLVRDCYQLLADKKVAENVIKKLENTSPTTFRKHIRDGLIKFRIVVPPFTDVEFEDIKTAADLLEIPLDEHVYIPSLKCWTKEPVPVGYSYVQVLEQLSEIYANIRSAGKYQGLTGQATKGKI